MPNAFRCISCFCTAQYIVFSAALPPLDDLHAVCVWVVFEKIRSLRRRGHAQVVDAAKKGDRGVGKELRAAGYTSGAATQLRTDSCRHPVWMNSWPGCLGEKEGEEKEIQRLRKRGSDR